MLIKRSWIMLFVGLFVSLLGVWFLTNAASEVVDAISEPYRRIPAEPQKNFVQNWDFSEGSGVIASGWSFTEIQPSSYAWEKPAPQGFLWRSDSTQKWTPKTLHYQRDKNDEVTQVLDLGADFAHSDFFRLSFDLQKTFINDKNKPVERIPTLRFNIGEAETTGYVFTDENFPLGEKKSMSTVLRWKDIFSGDIASLTGVVFKIFVTLPDEWIKAQDFWIDNIVLEKVIPQYKVTFKDGEEVLGETGVTVNTSWPLPLPEVVEKVGSKFLGWTIDGTNLVDPLKILITKDTEFKALWKDSDKDSEKSDKDSEKSDKDSEKSDNQPKTPTYSGGWWGGRRYKPEPKPDPKPEPTPTPTTPEMPDPIIYRTSEPPKTDVVPMPTVPAEENTKIQTYVKVLPKTGVLSAQDLQKKAGIRRNAKVETNLPSAETFRLAGSTETTLAYWLQVLPKQDQKADQYIILPKQGLVMPVNTVAENSKVYNNFIHGRTENFLPQLHNGAVQLPGTSLWNYGQVGNKVIAGHSSYWKNSAARYKTHFQKIIGMEKGEQIWIYQKTANGDYQRFVYNVDASYNTADTDISVIKPTANDQLTLMTCTPIGGVAGRWIVKSTFVGH